MEPAAKGQRRSSKRLTFTGPRTLVAWLESPSGAEVRQTIESRWLPNLAARLFDNSEESRLLQAEVIERAGKETRCIVVAAPMENGSVHITCYGPRELLVKIITLPKVPLTPEFLAASEKLIEVELPRAYKPWFYPAMVRQTAVVEALDVLEWSEREKTRMANLSFVKALNGAKK
jgi:hypothetical protein